MRRNVVDDLVKWKNSKSRKPLVLKGARQVGKTWLMKHFAKEFYQNYVYFNFDEDVEIRSIFETSKDPQRIIQRLSMITGQAIVPEKTLIIFDEIQESSAALNSLKYFNEKANEYHVIAAGSLLGTLLAAPQSYPVGQVNLLEIHPMKFNEFLAATDENLYNFYCSVQKNDAVENIFHSRLSEAYDTYLIVGGMPECVASWAAENDPAVLERIQKELLALYENDFAKHNSKINSGRILMVFRSLVSQLAKQNEKFIYGAVKESGRARDFEEAIEWLVSAGIVNRVFNVSKTEHPIAAFDELNCFKLFMFDTGLLKNMAGIDNLSLLTKSDFQFKGVLAENYVLQQLRGVFDIEPRYFATKSGEIDFIVQSGSEIVPIEVKAGKDRNSVSFKNYVKKYSPLHAVRFSRMGYLQNGAITNIPLYFAGKIRELM